jgi:ribosomal protein S11
MSRAPDDFDGITSAFLGGVSVGTKSRPVAHASLMPTLLIVGNVPTLAGIWIAQYADQQARIAGPVALIRLDGAASRGEVYRAQGRALPTDGVAWMERASIFARSWIVCTDCQSDPTAIALSGCSLVFLSGTDETALAAAKKTIEAVVQAGKIAGAAPCEIALAFVGSPETSAQAACNSLIAWAAERTLSVRLSLGAHSPRVDRVESSGPVPLAMLSSLDVAAAVEFIGIAKNGNPDRFSDRDRPMARPAVVSQQVHIEESQAPVDIVPKDVTPSIAAPLPTTSHQESSATSSGVVRDYFPEFTALAFNCPDAATVQLASDEFAALHLIQSNTGTNGLRIAAGWARANWKLLCAACPQLNSTHVRVIEHILLDDARDAALLHRTGVLLHARIDVAVMGAVVRRRVDLNSSETA